MPEPLLTNLRCGLPAVAGAALFALVAACPATARAGEGQGPWAGSCREGPMTPVAMASVPVDAPLEFTPDPGAVLDLRGVRLWAEPPRNPLVIKRAEGDVCVLGPTIIGRAARDASWFKIKHEQDSDGVRFARATGRFILEDAHIENVADAVAPPKAPDTVRAATFSVRGVYACFIRDDFVENDAALGGEVRDTLVDGTHVFLSARPGRGIRETFPPATLTVRDTLVRLDCKPDDRPDGHDTPVAEGLTEGACGMAKSLGMPFKWSPAARNLYLDIADTIIRVDAAGRNGPRSMDFPAGSYRNVTLIWLGQGPYPGRLPDEGVAVTTDTGIWEAARAAWLEKHGYTPGEPCASR